MNELFFTIILIQIPIVFCIFFMCQQAAIFLGLKEFRPISYGWLINVCYLFAMLALTKKTFDEEILRGLMTLLNLASMYFFLRGIFRSHQLEFYNRISHLSPAIPFFLFLLAGILHLIPNSVMPFHLPWITVKDIPYVLVNFTVLFSLSRVFRQYNAEFPQARFLYWSTIPYAIIQFLVLLRPESFSFKIMDVGFVCGFACKFIFLISLSALVIRSIAYAEKQKARLEKEKLVMETALEMKIAFAEKLNQIIGRTFHEITPPLLEIESIVNNLLQNDEHKNADYRISKKTKEEIDKLEDSIYRAQTILTASSQMYHSDVTRLAGDTSLFTLPMPIDMEEDIHNINTLIQVAILNYKSTLIPDPSNPVPSGIRFRTEFGGGCDIFCNSVEIVQVFYNLFKNAYEAAEGPDPSCTIFIRTKNSNEKDPADETKMIKCIRVEVEDYGPGIPAAISSQVFQQGFSTKENKGRMRGFGLDIVKTYSEKNHGTIVIESPVLRPSYPEAGSGPGTKFIISFPKVVN